MQAMQQQPLKLISAQSLIQNHFTGQQAQAFPAPAAPQPQPLQQQMSTPNLQSANSMNGFVLAH